MTEATTPRYRAHAQRAGILAGASPEPLASYWSGYRLGMARATREDPAPQDDAELARDAQTDAVISGEGKDFPLTDYARWCGYHDGQRWADVTAHRGLLRLAIAVSGASNRGFALGVLEMDDAALRQMLAGSRPVPATRHAELMDVIVAAGDK